MDQPLVKNVDIWLAGVEKLLVKRFRKKVVLDNN